MSAKRLITAIFIFLLLGAAGYLLPLAIYQTAIPTVTLTAPIQKQFTEQIPLSGTVVAQNQADLICDLPLIPSQVLVKVGETVKAGDTAAIIDKEQSVKAIAALLSAAGSLKKLDVSYAALFEELNIQSYDDLLDLIPQKLIIPANGTVVSLSLQQNAMITPRVSCLTVADCENLSVRLSIGESDIDKLSLGDRLLLKSGATADSVYTAYVTEIAPAASEVLSGTSLKTMVEITAALRQTNNLKPGYSVYGYRFLENPTDKQLVLTDAVFQLGEVECVYIFESGKAICTPITTDGFYGDYTVVTDGIHAEDIIIVSEQPNKLKDGCRVRMAE